MLLILLALCLRKPNGISRLFSIAYAFDGNGWEPGKSDPRHHEWYVQQMSQTSQRVVLETLAYLSTVDLTPILPQITTPALVMVGELSAMNTPDRAQHMVELLPHGTLVQVPGASGYVQHSAPAQCVAIWRDFVKTCSPASSAP